MDNLAVETKETVVLLGAQEDKTLPLSDATTVVLLKRCGMRRRGTWSSTRRHLPGWIRPWRWHIPLRTDFGTAGAEITLYSNYFSVGIRGGPLYEHAVENSRALGNANYADGASRSMFKTLSAQGITLSGFYSLTHPSQPNHVAAAEGDFFNLAP
ncbi:hypothetical protein SCLCIDRAFT_24667 [Scleroderma citrinum Foug A]|uniref:Uncharacterized protein n=1 Tax=Scleroderma citrinum Foug A TaxID=1036808 RepID=A0A0C3E2X1_9AGAM|nr:hypothetical protein SCLCIDRAFT_24667 [Scleroderma citrinum Foug A]